MSTLLVRNAEMLVTMDEGRRELKEAGLYAEESIIRAVGPTTELPAHADVVLDLSGQIVLPGFVNTHHHLDQTLTRNLPAAQNNNLFPWLQAHYRIWAARTPEATRYSTLIGLAELAMTGCTTVFDHSYVFQNGCRVDDQIAAAKEIPARAFMLVAVQCRSANPEADCRQTIVSRMKTRSCAIAAAQSRPSTTRRMER